MIIDLQRKHFGLPISSLSINTNKQLAKDFLGHFPDKTTLISDNLPPSVGRGRLSLFHITFRFKNLRNALLSKGITKS